jgi:hypothetical protein
VTVAATLYLNTARSDLDWLDDRAALLLAQRAGRVNEPGILADIAQHRTHLTPELRGLLQAEAHNALVAAALLNRDDNTRADVTRVIDLTDTDTVVGAGTTAGRAALDVLARIELQTECDTARLRKAIIANENLAPETAAGMLDGDTHGELALCWVTASHTDDHRSAVFAHTNDPFLLAGHLHTRYTTARLGNQQRADWCTEGIIDTLCERYQLDWSASYRDRPDLVELVATLAAGARRRADARSERVLPYTWIRIEAALSCTTNGTDALNALHARYETHGRPQPDIEPFVDEAWAQRITNSSPEGLDKLIGRVIGETQNGAAVAASMAAAWQRTDANTQLVAQLVGLCSIDDLAPAARNETDPARVATLCGWTRCTLWDLVTVDRKELVRALLDSGKGTLACQLAGDTGSGVDVLLELPVSSLGQQGVKAFNELADLIDGDDARTLFEGLADEAHTDCTIGQLVERCSMVTEHPS